MCWTSAHLVWFAAVAERRRDLHRSSDGLLWSNFRPDGGKQEQEVKMLFCIGERRVMVGTRGFLWKWSSCVRHSLRNFRVVNELNMEFNVRNPNGSSRAKTLSRRVQ